MKLFQLNQQKTARFMAAAFFFCVCCSGIIARAGSPSSCQMDSLVDIPPDSAASRTLVLHFKKTFSLTTVPAKFVIDVSADNRFILFVNGERIGDGPARGDLANWRYETFDIASHLKTGDNTISATVRNFGVYAPVAQMSNRTAFLVQGDTMPKHSSIPTIPGWWKRSRDKSRFRGLPTAFTPTSPLAPARLSRAHATTGLACGCARRLRTLAASKERNS